MRTIGRLDDAARAAALSDVLVARGIANDVRPDGAQVVVWIHDDARVGEAREALAAFEAAGGAGFDDEVAAGRARRREVEAKDRAYRARAAQARQSIHGADGRGWLTIGVLAASLVVAAVTNLGGSDGYVLPLLISEYPAAAGLPEVRAGQVWRLVSPILIHFGFLHLFFNLANWWAFAQRIEVRKGLSFFLPFALTAAVVSNLCEFAWGWATAPQHLRAVGGLSGVLYALFGYAITKGRFDPLDRIEVPESTTRFLLLWLVLCFTGVFGPVANVAHLSGLVWGVLYAGLDMAFFRLRKRRR